MAKALSYTMQHALAKIGDDWTDVTYSMSTPTLDALEKRGLIEWRFSGRHYKHARRVPKAATP